MEFIPPSPPESGLCSCWEDNLLATNTLVMMFRPIHSATVKFKRWPRNPRCLGLGMAQHRRAADGPQRATRGQHLHANNTHRCPFWLVCLKIEGPGLPGGSIFYQGHLFSQKDTYDNTAFRNIARIASGIIVQDGLSNSRL